MAVVTIAATLLAPPVGPVDPFMADRSPRAIAFRDAWQEAVVLERHLDPPPEGVTGERQRELVIEAFERAVAIMPEAPPCAGLLLRAGELWNSPAVAPERPAKALEVYARVRKEYPTDDRAVIRAIAGQSYALWLLKRPADAARAAEELLRYELPGNAPPETSQILQTLKAEMAPHLLSYRAEAVGLDADNGEILLPGGGKLSEHLDATTRSLNEQEASRPWVDPMPSPSSASLAARRDTHAAADVSVEPAPRPWLLPLWAWVSTGAIVLGCVAVFLLSRAMRKGG